MSVGTLVNLAKNLSSPTRKLPLKFVQYLYQACKSLGLKVTVDSGHKGTAWNSYHMHIGNARIHLALSQSAYAWLIKILGKNSMFIELLDVSKKYRGIQRTQNSLYNCKFTLLKRYLNLLNGEKIIFSNSNLKEAINISEEINSNANNRVNEVIIFGQEDVEIENDSTIFLGYDISGESCYLSPIKTVFFESSKSLVLDNINASFCHMLNSNGLFKLKSDADSFSEYLNSHNHCEFENDGKLLPIKVYLKKDNLR